MIDPQHRARTQARVAHANEGRRHARLWATAGAGIVAIALAAGMAKAQDDPLAGLNVTHGVSTFGDLKYGPDFTHLDYVNPDAPKGGELSFSWSSGSFDSVHPYTRKGRSAVLASIFFESMLGGTADEIGSSYCVLCESIAYPDDKSYVIFTIHEDAAFSDGTPVTADDALFSFEILRDEGLPSFRASIIKTLAGAEVLNERQIRFDFVEDAPLRGRIEAAGGLPVFSRASHEAAGIPFEDSRLEPLMGSGPYVLGDLDVGRSITYVRNPGYWGWDLPIMQGRSNFDTIRIQYFGDAIAAFEGFTAGEYTFRQESSSVTWANNYDFPGLEAGYVIREELPDLTMPPGQAFTINTRRPQLSDVRVRQAIQKMFNFEWTNATLFFGLYSQQSSFWHNTDLAATGLPEGAELAILEPLRDQLPPEVFEEEVFSLEPSDEGAPRDRRKARQALRLLEEAGWVPGDDGLVRNADGDTLEVEFLNTSPLFDRIINPYVENLRSIGVDARLTRVDSAQLTERERSYDFDIITDHYPMSYEPGSGLRQYFGSETSDSSVFNLAGVSDPAIDVLIETVVDAETRDEMVVAVRALDRVLRWEQFRIPQWYNPNHWVAYYDMYEYPDPLPPYSLGFLDFWWHNADKEAALREAGAL